MGETGLKIEIVSKPTECKRFAKKGDKVSMNYVGTLEDGDRFDSSRGKPIDFQLGVGRVIKGWDEGIRGMCIGEKRKLIIPSHLGYGDKGKDSFVPIPGGATLYFDVELMNIRD